jgi:hypothetical protein
VIGPIRGVARCSALPHGNVSRPDLRRDRRRQMFGSINAMTDIDALRGQPSSGTADAHEQRGTAWSSSTGRGERAPRRQPHCPGVMPLQSGVVVIEVYASEASASHPSDPGAGPAGPPSRTLPRSGLRGAANVAGIEAKTLPSARLGSRNRVMRGAPLERTGAICNPWVPRTLPHHATCTYSCRRPSSRSRRRGRMVAPEGRGVRPAGGCRGQGADDPDAGATEHRTRRL